MIKNKNKNKRDMYLDLTWELKKPMEHEGYCNSNCN